MSAVSGSERFIILLRHGLAEDATAGTSDEERSLSAEGHAEMKQIARGLERAMPRADAIYSSPLLRAQQTALWVSKAYRSRVQINTVDALVPGASTGAFRAFVDSIQEKRAVIVGHEPNLTRNLRALVGIDETDRIELQKGGCYGIRLDAHGGVLEWLLPPRILRKLGE